MSLSIEEEQKLLNLHLNVKRRVSAEKLSLVAFAESDEFLVLNGEMAELVSKRHDVVL